MRSEPISAILVKIPPQIRSAGAEGFTDGKTDEGRTGHFAGHEDQDNEHHDEFHADEKNADAHAGRQRDVEKLDGFAFQGCKGHPGIGQGVHPDTEPGDPVGAENTDHGPGQDQKNILHAQVLEETEIIENTNADEDKQDQQ
jgi:hypothetical protein